MTDNSIQIATDKRIVETVVPTSYKTKTGALNKARALQYCLGRFFTLYTGEREREAMVTAYYNRERGTTPYKTKSGALNKARALQYCLGRFVARA